MSKQQPEALRLADIADDESWAFVIGVRKDIAAELRRLHAYCQELESQVIRDCMTHAQKPAEIEHVAGDVSKNGVELNMCTVPAYAQQVAIYAELPPRYYLAGGVEKTWDQHQMHAFADATCVLRVESLAAAYREELDKLSQRNYELLHASHGQASAETGNSVSAQTDSVQEDAARLDFIERHPEMSLRHRKGRWAFLGFTNYEYDLHQSLREAIDAAMNKGANHG